MEKGTLEILKLNAYDNVKRIYSDLKLNKLRNIKDNYNDLFLYFDILERSKKYIPILEYKKLKSILNDKLNNLFRSNNWLKNELCYIKNKGELVLWIKKN